MRKLGWFLFACGWLALSNVATAQDVDFAAGGSTLFAAHPTSASQAFQPPAEKGGVYPSISLQYMRWGRFGLNGEFVLRYKEGLYNGFQFFRPTLYDVNGVYAYRVSDRSVVHLMAGAGAQTAIFYNKFHGCNSGGGVCVVEANSTHVMVDFGADLRYKIWRRFFIRPEGHYYRVINNTQFHSDNLFRAGASIGYTFGPK